MSRDGAVEPPGPAIVRGTVLSRKPLWLRSLVWVVLGLACGDLLLRFTVTGERFSVDAGDAELLWLGVGAVACTGMFKYDEESFRPAVLDALFYASLVTVLVAVALRVSTLIGAVSR